MSLPKDRLAAITLLAQLNRDIFAAKTADYRNQSYSALADINAYVGKTQILADKVEALIKTDEAT